MGSCWMIFGRSYGRNCRRCRLLRHLLFLSRHNRSWPRSSKSKMKRVCWMTLKCSAEPKRRYVAQIAVFTEEAEPFWLRNKMYPRGQESGLRHRAAQKYAEIPVSDSRFSLCPARCVLWYSKQGLCVPQKSQSQPKSAASLGAQPPIPRKERCGFYNKCWGKQAEPTKKK